MRAEGQRQELSQSHRAMGALRPAEMDLEIVGGELAKLLTAAAARRDNVGSGADHEAFDDAVLAGGDQGGDGRGLGTKALRKGRILDVAAAVDAAIFIAHDGTDMELRIRRVGP